MICRSLVPVLTTLLILSTLSPIILAAEPRTVRGYVYVNGVITKPDQVVLSIGNQNIPATGLFDDGYYIIDFSAEDGETGTFTVVVNGENYLADETITTESGVYVYDIDLHVWVPENHPPNKPSNPSPSDGSTDVDIDVTLSWQCSDPDGDTLTYDVYFGTSSNPPKVSSNQSSTSFDPGTLQHSTTYYWKIVAWDEHGEKNESKIWSFTTKDKPPSGEEGTGGGTGEGTGGGTTGGGTTGGGAATGGAAGGAPPNNPPVADPDGPYYGLVGDVIVFNASASYDTDGSITGYRWDFDGDGAWDTGWLTNPQTNHTYLMPGNYTVKLQVKDDKNATSTAQTTAIIVQAFNYPPSEPSIDGPTSGVVNESYNFTIVATDNDSAFIKYFIDWGDGTSTETEFLPNGSTIQLSHVWPQPGNYTIRIKAYDNNTFSGETEWTISIKSKKTTATDMAIYYLGIGIALILLIILILVIAAKRKKKEAQEKKKTSKK